MITEEGARLAQHWDGLGREYLDEYLVQETEQPIWNAQSILVRASLLDRLFPGAGEGLFAQELEFSAYSSYALLGQREGWFAEFYRAVRMGDTAALPEFVATLLRRDAAVGFDLVETLEGIKRGRRNGFAYLVSPLAKAWHRVLAGKRGSAVRLMELGCGSANEYRFWDECHLARHLDYTGLDVSSANVANALERFPRVNFQVGDACELEERDQSQDVVLAMDLLEHLSAGGICRVSLEASRMSRDEIWISLFNAGWIEQHDIRPMDNYHWNLLSLPQLIEQLARLGFETEVLPVAEFMERRYAEYRHYNQEAFLLFARRV